MVVSDVLFNLTINQIFKINLIVKQATVNQKYEVTP